MIGSCVGPAPYPALVRDLQRRIGDEARAQLLEVRPAGCPTARSRAWAAGSNAIGTFIPFVDDEEVELIGVEAAGEGLSTQRHSAPLTTGARGVLHGALIGVIQDEEGQILEAHSISAGLDYPGVGPEHAWLRDSGRVALRGRRGRRGARRLPPGGGARGDPAGARVVARDRLAAGEPGAGARASSRSRDGATRTWPRCWSLGQ